MSEQKKWYRSNEVRIRQRAPRRHMTVEIIHAEGWKSPCGRWGAFKHPGCWSVHEQVGGWRLACAARLKDAPVIAEAFEAAIEAGRKERPHEDRASLDEIFDLESAPSVGTVDDNAPAVGIDAHDWVKERTARVVKAWRHAEEGRNMVALPDGWPDAL